MKLIRFDAPARRELHEGFRFYEARKSGLGKRWLAAVESTCQKIRHNPGTGRLATQGMRLCPVPNFLYQVIFENQRDCIYIFAVMHLRREPDYWASRVPRT